MNINQMMKQAQAMQKKMADAQEKIAELKVTGSSGGGLIEFSLNGKGEAIGIKIDTKVIDPDDDETLSDLIVAAHNDARKKLDDTVNDEMAKVTGGMGLPPGFNMP